MRKFSVRPTLTITGPPRSRACAGGRANRRTRRSPTSRWPPTSWRDVRRDRVRRPGRDLGARLLPCRHLRVHRRRSGVGVRGADRLLGLVEVDREGNAGAPDRERARLDDDRRHRARADEHRAAAERVRLPHLPDGRHPRDLDRRRPRWSRSVRRSAARSSSTTASTSRPRATAPSGTRRRPTSSPASTPNDRCPRLSRSRRRHA